MRYNDPVWVAIYAAAYVFLRTANGEASLSFFPDSLAKLREKAKAFADEEYEVRERENELP